jgi:hypothetical protein
MSGPEGNGTEEHEPPRGALLFILVYLLVVAIFWVNTYLRLWMRD